MLHTWLHCAVPHVERTAQMSALGASAGWFDVLL